MDVVFSEEPVEPLEEIMWTGLKGASGNMCREVCDLWRGFSELCHIRLELAWSRWELTSVQATIFAMSSDMEGRICYKARMSYWTDFLIELTFFVKFHTRNFYLVCQRNLTASNIDDNEIGIAGCPFLGTKSDGCRFVWVECHAVYTEPEHAKCQCNWRYLGHVYSWMGIEKWTAGVYIWREVIIVHHLQT